MKPHIQNALYLITGSALIAVSFFADTIGIGDANHGIGFAQTAGILAGLLIVGLGLVPSPEKQGNAPPSSSVCKPRSGFFILFFGLLLLFLVPEPFYLSYRVQKIHNLFHIPLFILLTVAVLQLSAAYPRLSRLRLPTCVLFLVILSFGSELIQYVIPGRWPSYGDLILNMVGITYGVLLFSFIEKLKPNLIRRLVCK